MLYQQFSLLCRQACLSLFAGECRTKRIDAKPHSIRIRAEHKIADNRQEIAAADRTAADMARDAEYVASYAGDRTTRLLKLPQATAEEIGRELHRIAKTYRSGAYGTIGTYAGLNLLVHSEYNWCGTFDRNVFFVEGPSGLKYRCGQYGALPLGFAETSRYPEITLNRLPSMIEEQRRKIARLESELPALEAIVARTWGKTDELSRLRQECRTLQQRIDEGLKEAERTQKPLAECGASDKAA